MIQPRLRPIIRLAVSVAGILGLLLTQTGLVNALSAEQTQLYVQGIDYYDATVPASCGSTSITPLAGNDNEQKAFNFFVSKGLKPFQAAGIVGNMIAESGVMPEQLESTPIGSITPAQVAINQSGGWGIVQWTPGSKFISTQNPISNANDLSVQLNFVWQQIIGQGPIPEKQAGTDIMSTTTLENAVLAWQGNKNVGGPYIGFERPRDEISSVAARTNNARAVLAKYGSGAPSADSGVGSGSSGTPSCGSSGDQGTGQISGSWAWPTQTPAQAGGAAVVITSCFGSRHGNAGGGYHPGTDIATAEGTPVYAAQGGTVYYAGPASDYGNNFVIIQVSSTVYESYGHMDAMSVQKGQTVQMGQRIGTVGNQGTSSGPHLHFNLSINPANENGKYNGNASPFNHGMTLPQGVQDPYDCLHYHYPGAP